MTTADATYAVAGEWQEISREAAQALTESIRAATARVLDALGERGALVLVAGPELRVGRDTELRYAPDADFFYLTGLVEPEAVLVLGNIIESGPCALFVRERDPERELWTGPVHGPERARELTGVDSAFPLRELPERLPDMLQG